MAHFSINLDPSYLSEYILSTLYQKRALTVLITTAMRDHGHLGKRASLSVHYLMLLHPTAHELNDSLGLWSAPQSVSVVFHTKGAAFIHSIMLLFHTPRGFVQANSYSGLCTESSDTFFSAVMKTNRSLAPLCSCLWDQIIDTVISAAQPLH